MILTVTLNPSVDRTVFVDGLRPHDTNRVLRTEIDAGGKGVNLSRIVQEVGGETLAAGFLGGSSGAFIKATLLREEVPFDFVGVRGETRVNVSVESGDGPPTTFNERGPTIQPGEWETLLERLRGWAEPASWVCFGGSIPPGLGPETYRDLSNRVKSWGKRVCVDADGEALKLALPTQPNLIKPNDDELSRLIGRDVDDAVQASQVAIELHRGGTEFVLVSLGAKGAVLSCSAGSWIAESPKVEAKSTIGSGDSLIGAFLTRLEAGDPPEEALRWGVAAGAATAMTDGSAIGNIETIRDLIAKAKIFPV